MKDIKHLVGIGPNHYKAGLYGVEIEVEGKRLPTSADISSAVWRVEVDGSLKADEAFEYVMPSPTPLVGVRSALDYLQVIYKNKKSIIDESVRAGVHVHLNVQDWDIKQVMTFATCYYLLEDILMDWCGPNRSGNLFCLRTRDAEYGLFKILDALRTRNLKPLKEDNIRYSSLNFCSLFKYGSLEFRGMRGTGDLDAIYRWVEIINDLRTTSLEFDSPVDVIATMSGDGEFAFLKRLLPTTNTEFEESTELATSIRQGARRVQMLAYGVDWSKISEPTNNPFKQETFA